MDRALATATADFSPHEMRLLASQLERIGDWLVGKTPKLKLTSNLPEKIKVAIRQLMQDSRKLKGGRP